MNTSIKSNARGKILAIVLAAALLFGVLPTFAPITTHAATVGGSGITWDWTGSGSTGKDAPDSGVVATMHVANDATLAADKAMVKDSQWSIDGENWNSSNLTQQTVADQQGKDLYIYTPLTGMGDSNTAVLPNIKADVTVDIDPAITNAGDYFMRSYAQYCTYLTVLAVPDTSKIESVGNYFMRGYAYGCTAITTLGAPNTSNITTVGDGFMFAFAIGCTSLTALGLPDTASIDTVEDDFMRGYAFGCTSLTALDVPNTANIEIVGDYFMNSYALGCTSLTALDVPDTSSIKTVGANFMAGYAEGCTALAVLTLPDTSSITSVPISDDYFMYEYAKDSTALEALVAPTAPGYFTATATDLSVDSGISSLTLYTTQTNKAAWAALTANGGFLYTNQIQATDNVIVELDVAIAIAGQPFFYAGSAIVPAADDVTVTAVYWPDGGTQPGVLANGTDYNYASATDLANNNAPGTATLTIELLNDYISGYIKKGNGVVTFNADGTWKLTGNTFTREITQDFPIYGGIVEDVAADPTGKTFSGTQNVTLSTTTGGADIYYTLNGTTPTTSSTKYMGAIALTATTTLKAIAVKANWIDSGVLSETYTFAPVNSVTISGAPKLAQHYASGKGNTLQLTAAVLPTYAAEKGLTWTSSNQGIATVDANGLVTLKGSEGTVKITAVAKDGSGKKHEVNIPVAKHITKVRAPLATLYIQKGKSLKIPTALDDNSDLTKALSSKLTWKSSNTKVLKVDKNGKITAAKKVTKKTKVTVTVTAANGKAQKLTVYVVPKKVAHKGHTIKGVPKGNKLSVGKTAVLTPKLKNAKATTLTVTYKSSNTKVLSVDKAGKIVAKKKGTAIISIKVGGKTVKTKKITVK